MPKPPPKLIKACPHLPEAAEAMSYRTLQNARTLGPEAAYTSYLRYGQQLWMHGLPARALLAVDKAMLLTLPAAAPVVQTWPIPYAALVWMLTEVDRSLFFGNPRAHYQHLADRMPTSLGALAKLRMWACWHLTCKTRPDFEPDPKHPIEPPGAVRLVQELDAGGRPGEAAALAQLLGIKTGQVDLFTPPSS